MTTLLGPDTRRYTIWYVTENRAPVDWAAAVRDNLATTTILRLSRDEQGREQVTLWARQGAVVDPARGVLARAEASATPVPGKPTAPVVEPSKFVTRDEWLTGSGPSAADGDAAVTMATTPAITKRTTGITGQVPTSMAVYTPLWSTRRHVFVTAPTTVDGVHQTRLVRLSADTGTVEQDVQVATVAAHDTFTGHRPASVAVTDAGTVVTHPTLHHQPWAGRHSPAGRVRDIVGLTTTTVPTGLDRHTSYRRFFRDPYTGALWLVSRGNDYRAYLYRWRASDRTWEARGGGPFADPGAYGHELAFGPGGVMWAVPEWRVNPSGAQSGYPRRDIGLVKSTDAGATWTTATGTPVVLPLMPARQTVLFPGVPGASTTAGHSGVLARVTVDGKGRPVVVAAWRHPLRDGDFRSLWMARLEADGSVTRRRIMESHAQWDVGNPHAVYTQGGYIAVVASRRDDHLPASTTPSNSETNSSNYPDSSLALLTTTDGGDTWTRCDLDGGADGLGLSGAWLDPQSLRLAGVLRLMPVSQRNPGMAEVWSLTPPGAPAADTDHGETGDTTTTTPDTGGTTPPAPLAAYRSAVLTDTPNALWMLDESTGNAADAVGTHTATPNGQLTRPGADLTTFAGGHFAATTIGNFGSGITNVGVTVEFLIRSTDTANRRAVLGVTNTGFTTGLSVFVNSNATGGVLSRSIALVMRNEAGSNRVWSIDVPGAFDGALHHVALVTNGSSGFTGYLDGVPVATGTSNVSGTTGTTGTYGNFGFPLLLGATNARGTVESPFVGALGGIALHLKQVSAARVAAHASAARG